jgi:hypothetical protein
MSSPLDIPCHYSKQSAAVNNGVYCQHETPVTTQPSQRTWCISEILCAVYPVKRKTFFITVRWFFWIRITNCTCSTTNFRLSKVLSQHCLTHLTLIQEVPTTTVSTLFPIVFLKHETAQCKPRGCVVPYLCGLELCVKSSIYYDKYGLMVASLCSRNM